MKASDVKFGGSYLALEPGRMLGQSSCWVPVWVIGERVDWDAYQKTHVFQVRRENASLACGALNSWDVEVKNGVVNMKETQDAKKMAEENKWHIEAIQILESWGNEHSTGVPCEERDLFRIYAAARTCAGLAREALANRRPGKFAIDPQYLTPEQLGELLKIGERVKEIELRIKEISDNLAYYKDRLRTLEEKVSNGPTLGMINALAERVGGLESEAKMPNVMMMSMIQTHRERVEKLERMHRPGDGPGV